METITITTNYDWSDLDRRARIRLWAEAVKQHAAANGDRDQADNCSVLWLDPSEPSEWRVQQMIAYAEAHGLTLRIEQPPVPLPAPPRVLDVTRHGVDVLFNGRQKFVSWSDLHDASRQDDPVYAQGRPADVALAETYRRLLADARKKVEGNRQFPVTCAVYQNETNVWWVAGFADVSGNRTWIPRPADCGGTLPTKADALHEMRERAEYLRSLGYTVVEANHG